MSSNLSKGQIRGAIVRHIELYPDASDTIEGIQRFWLEGREDEPDPALVEDVLDDLVQNGVLRTRRLPDGGVMFSAARTAREDH